LIQTEGVKSTFHAGVCYRYPGLPPMLEVKGTHFEMGLQYGALLRPEILKSLGSYKKIFKWWAVKIGIPEKILTAGLKFRGRQICSRLPERFRQEYRGIAQGAGISYDAVMAVSMFYDFGMTMACTGLLMRGENGTVIHGRNQDSTDFGGEEIGKMTVIVKYHAFGYNTVTQLDWPLWMGIETGYNDKGLAFSEETLAVRNPDPEGFSIIYLARMALEESDSLDDLPAFFDKYGVINGYGTVWSDRDEGRGMVTELTPKGWATQELKDPILWNFNHIYDKGLKKYENPEKSLNVYCRTRDRIATSFPVKSQFTIRDAVNFLRASTDEKGRDYTWYGSRTPICNNKSQQMIIFDPENNGFYMALGQHYAARRNVYHFYDDFSRRPELYMAAKPLDPVVEQEADIYNMLLGNEDKLLQYIAMAKKYPYNANAQFLAAFHAFNAQRYDLFTPFAAKAYTMDKSNMEYRLYAGLAAYYQANNHLAAELLEDIDDTELYGYEKVLAYAVLERVLPHNKQKAYFYGRKLNEILAENHAFDYYKENYLPLLKTLGRGG